jgi:MoaA/NifB/PqqE/SkfB family radical SAM enzyme
MAEWGIAGVNMSLVSFAPKLLWKKGSMPIYITFFVTNKCNLTCRHCFVNPTDDKELTLEEIKKISKSMPNLLVLSLTGGEPFLRKDLPEIAQIFQPEILEISTNGLLTGFIEKEIDRLLSRYHRPITVEISLDGIGAEHDRIRGLEGAFESAIATYKSLRKKRLSLAIAITFSSENQDHVEKLIDFAAKLKPDSINLSLIRGVEHKPVHMNKYAKACRQIEGLIKARKIKGHKIFGNLAAANSIVVRSHVQKTVLKGYQSPCYAGLLKAIIQSNGEVFACEMLPKLLLGNLRTEKYNLRKIWLGEKAKRARAWIKRSRCHCTHECDISVNTLFNPLVLPKVVRKAVEFYALPSR